MLPAKTYYDRILWDPSLDASLYTICYEDRSGPIEQAELPGKGFVEVTFGSFLPAEVPWHRIRQFRCAGRVVWEREPHKARAIT